MVKNIYFIKCVTLSIAFILIQSLLLPARTNFGFTGTNSCGNNDSISDNNNSYENKKKASLKISLEKYSYKMYEPVLSLIEYVNNSMVNDTISNLYSEIENYFGFHIKPLDGQFYERSPLPYSILTEPLKSILKSKDTVLISREISEFGIYPSLHDYFSKRGYLIPGRYQLVAGTYNKCVSDTLEFEILPLNGEDSLLLNLLVEKKYKEILNTYPNSPFYESVLSFYATKSYRPKNIRNHYLKDEIMSLYKTFFNKFPDSYYGFNITFVGYLLIKLTTSTNDFSSKFKA